jgi:hypothetical protein
MKKIAGIYTLKDPETGKVRYVGLTTNAKRRKWMHSSLSHNQGGRRVSRWIRSLLKRGLAPVFTMVEETTNLGEREQHWIAHFNNNGCDLLNMNAGGNDNEHMLAAPHSPRGRKPDPVQEMLRSLRKGIKFARDHDLGDLEGYINAALEKHQLAQAGLTKALGSRSAANAELNKRLAERRANG